MVSGPYTGNQEATAKAAEIKSLEKIKTAGIPGLGKENYFYSIESAPVQHASVFRAAVAGNSGNPDVFFFYQFFKVPESDLMIFFFYGLAGKGKVARVQSQGVFPLVQRIGTAKVGNEYTAFAAAFLQGQKPGRVVIANAVPDEQDVR